MITTPPAMPATLPARTVNAAATPAAAAVKRVSSAGLMDGGRELEIDHGGRIYRLRITQLNKLILTA